MGRLPCLIRATLWLSMAWSLSALAQSTPDKSVYILLDTSGSMTGAGMNMAQTALGTLLDEMKAEGGYRVALIKGSSSNLVVPFGTSNLEQIRSKIGFGDGVEGNPTVDLQHFRPGGVTCHVVLLVTDGDDGSNPVDPANHIRSQCSRLFVVGVGLGSTSEAVLSNIARVGGGRFCNGADATGVTRCILSVFKRFNFDVSRGACTDTNGFRGLNPRPRLEKLAMFENLDCYDFSGMDFTSAALREKIRGVLAGNSFRFPIRGSNFSGANLSGMTLDTAMTAANFTNANLKNTSIQPPQGQGHSLNFAGADLASARVSTPGAGCAQHWRLVGAKLSGARLTDVSLCDLSLEGAFDYGFASNASLTRVNIGSGLTLNGTKGSGLTLSAVTGGALTFSGLEVDEVRLEKLALTRLVVRDVGRAEHQHSRIRWRVRDSRVGTDTSMAGSYFEVLEIDGLSTAKLDLKDVAGRLAVANSNLGTIDSTGADPEFVKTAVGSGTLRGFREVRFTEQSRCNGCRLETRAGERVVITDSTLERLALGDQTAMRVFIEARDAVLTGAIWKNVQWEKDSSLEDVDLRRSSFQGTPLNLVMLKVQLDESSFVKSPVEVLDGSEEIQCARCGNLDVVLRTPYVDGLRFVGTATTLLSHEHRPEVRNLDVSHGSLKPVSSFAAMTCSDCTFVEAKVSGGFEGVVLENPQAQRSEFSGFSYLDGEPLEIRGGSFEGAVLKGHGEYFRVLIDQVNFNSASFSIAPQGEISGSLFVGATLEKGIRESQVYNSDFSRAVFPMIGAGVPRTTFVRTKFSGASFPDGSEHSDGAVFESCWFDGPYGRANIKRLVEGAKGLRVTIADWSGLDLSEVRQENVELVSVDLRNANLRGASLSGLRMDDVTLIGADLSSAWLDGELSNSYLDRVKVDAGSHIRGKLTGVSLESLEGSERMSGMDADLEDVDLSGSDIHNSHFDDQRSFRRLTLSGAVVPCNMYQAMLEQGTVTYGAFRVQEWDSSGVECAVQPAGGAGP